MLVVNGVKITVDADGCMTLPTKNKKTVHLMDTMYQKVKEGVWMNRSTIWKRFLNLYLGQSIHIVGKGPSLDNLEPFEGVEPIIGVNHAVGVVEKLNPHNPNIYGIMRDTACGVFEVKNATMFLSRPLMNIWKDYDKKVQVEPCEIYGLAGGITAKMALGVAKIFGCCDVHLWCFDACVKGEKGEGYAKKLHRHWGKALGAYKAHRRVLEQMAADLKLKIYWRLPDGTTDESAYKLLKCITPERG